MEAENGQKGWEAALASLPDLVITDVMMPELDGLSLCQRLKSHAATLHIPVILLTARAGTEDKIEGLLTGADDYLTKPFHGRELAVRATNLIEERKRLREHFGRQVLLQPAPPKFLAQKAGNVSEVAYRVGFKEPSYFSRCFSQAYGCSPSEYRSASAPGG
jgi:DNA-binding response OmpR family regulator